MKKGTQDGNRHPLEVSNYLLNKKEIVYTPMKLIKMVYIAHGWFMALYSENRRELLPLVKEDVQAWKHGPVFPSIFHAVKQFGYFRIDDLLFGLDNGEEFSRREKALLDKVASAYGVLSGAKLSDMTHEEGTPWHKMYEKDALFKVIPNERIYSYYKKKIVTKGKGDERKAKSK